MEKLPTEPSEPQARYQISINTLVRFLLFFASGWALLTIFQFFEDIFFTFSVAAIIAFLLNYPVRYLERFLGRGFALGVVIILTLLVIIGLIIALGISILGQLEQLILVISQNLSATDNPLNQFQRFLDARDINIQLTPLEDLLKDALTSSLNFAIDALSALPNTFLTFVVILVVSFFMLIDGEKLWHLILNRVPSHRRTRFLTVVQRSFLGFFRGQMIIALFLCITTFPIFVLLKIPFALTLSIVIGFFDAIPGIGATLGVFAVGLIVLIQGGWVATIKVVFVCVVLQQIQDNFVAPRVMQSAVNLNPVVIFLALMIGAKLAQLWGIFLSVPIAAAIVNWLEIEEMQSSQDKLVDGKGST